MTADGGTGGTVLFRYTDWYSSYGSLPSWVRTKLCGATIIVFTLSFSIGYRL